MTRTGMLLGALLTLSCASAADPRELEGFRQQAALTDASRQVVLDWYRAVDDGRIDAAMALFHPDLKWFNPADSPEPTTQAGARELFEGVFAAFPTWTHRIEDIFAVGDRVAVRTVNVTRQVGEFQGLPATGNDVTFGVLVLFRVQDGKIIEIREQANSLAFVTQLGMEVRPRGR